MAKYKFYDGTQWVELLANAGASPKLNNGTVVTQPQGDNALSIKTTGTASDTGIFYLSEDASYVCNSGDSGYVFAVFDKDVTQDFSTPDNAAFAIYQSSQGVIMKGNLTVGGSITSAGNTVVTSANIGSYAITSLSGYATQDWVGTYYLGINNKAADSDKLDGNDSSYFINTSNIGSQNVNYANSAGNADTVDNEHASAFAHRGVGNNLITAGNEFNFIPSGYGGSNGGSVWINYETDVRDHSGNITEYILGKGNGQQLGTIIHSGNIGSQYVAYASLAGGVAWANVNGRPTDLNDFTNNAGYIKGIDSSMVTTALGYTPANSSSLSNYLPTSGGTITNSGSPLLTLKRNTNGGAFIGFKSSNQDTYIWYNGSTSSNALRFSFSSDGGSTSVKKMELDNSGNLEVVGSISEAGTGLSSKYLGINSTAADSSKLNGQSASYYLNYNNLSNTPTIPSSASDVGALPNTTTYGKSLSISGTSLSLKDQNGTTLSTVTVPSGGGSSGWSTEMYMHTINFQINMGGAYFGAASITYVCEADAVFPDLYSVAYYMYYHGPNYNDDLPYVSLIPASGFVYNVSHKYTVYGACYINRNGNDYVRLAAVTEGGSVEYLDVNDNTLMGNTVVTDRMIRIN